ncbi:MAG: hypothetical protein WD690_02835 [Vicinamibacterales bacterium]
MKRSLGSQRGVSLVEVTIILAVVAMLASILAPSVNGYVDQARQARARQDTQVIAEAILDFVADNAEHQFLITASGGGMVPPTRGDTNRVNLLVSDGDIPTTSTALTETFWTQAVNGGTVDTLSNHVIVNDPGYRNPTNITTTTPGGTNIDFARAESSGFNAPYSWRGAYLRGPVRADPWGNRYAVNVAFMDPSPVDAFGAGIITTGFLVADYARLDVFVLSAGGDKEIDTKSAQDGAVPGDDDFIFLVSSNAK